MGIGIIVVIYGIMQKYKGGRLAKAPFVKTRDAASNPQSAGERGAVSVQGAIECPRPLASPVTGTPCLYYELKVEGSWKEGDATKSKDYVADKIAAPFAVNDGTGSVPVDASKGGDFELKQTFDQTKKEGLFADLKNALGKGEPIMFGNYAFPNPPLSKASSFRCIERVVPLPANNQLFVMGKLQEGVIASPSWASLVLSSK
ncbi:MAG: E3 ubiquitin ligase family protein, partial [Sandaracinaceae bacterium]|nr:E3 ubiquitin ligase family protein [Sandaracinaceae bacterium]